MLIVWVLWEQCSIVIEKTLYLSLCLKCRGLIIKSYGLLSIEPTVYVSSTEMHILQLLFCSNTEITPQVPINCLALLPVSNRLYHKGCRCTSPFLAAHYRAYERAWQPQWLPCPDVPLCRPGQRAGIMCAGWCLAEIGENGVQNGVVVQIDGVAHQLYELQLFGGGKLALVVHLRRQVLVHPC